MKVPSEVLDIFPLLGEHKSLHHVLEQLNWEVVLKLLLQNFIQEKQCRCRIIAFNTMQAKEKIEFLRKLFKLTKPFCTARRCIASILLYFDGTELTGGMIWSYMHIAAWRSRTLSALVLAARVSKETELSHASDTLERFPSSNKLNNVFQKN